MSQSIFHVRPLDAGKGWAIDEYDGRGAWQHSVLKTPEGAPMDKQQAQRAVFQLRRKTVNSATKAEPVNREDGGVKPGEAPYSPIPDDSTPLSPDETIARLGYRLGRLDQQRFVESACRKQLDDDHMATLLRGFAADFPTEPVSFSSIVAAVHHKEMEKAISVDAVTKERLGL